MSSYAISTSREILYLPIDKVQPNTYQPRKIFNHEALLELSDSIKQYGVLQPITVRLTQGYTYELVAGERRLRAAKIAGLITIPAIVINISDKDSAVIALIENLQRKDLNFIEEAEGFQNLIKDHNFTQDMLAKRIGKTQSTVANKLRILRLSPTVRRKLTDNNLTERHARALLRLPSEQAQIDVLSQVIENSLNVSDTEDLISKINNTYGDNVPAKKQEENKKPSTKKSRRRILFKTKDIKIFANSIKQTVETMEKSGFKTLYDIEKTPEGYEFRIKVECK
ncbi:MAG: nucleoid occlusion protein [Clostridiales bacterium]|jgi:ParB family chromosome partitioning protein|nr:nucleoid occlusion protein [Clostridiales bacterium]